MRVGSNPFKENTDVPRPKTVTIGILVHIPFLSGYYLDSLDVLKLCILSIIHNTDDDYDLMVFDNASCPEVVTYLTELHDNGTITYLIRSKNNVGKNNAWNAMFGAAPGEFLAYCDSDIYFCPGWLSQHLHIMRSFPNVGTVNGCPITRHPSFAERTIELAEANAEINVNAGKLIPKERTLDFMKSLAKNMTTAEANLDDAQDHLLTFNGTSAYACGGHFEFLIPTEFARTLIPLQCERLCGGEEQRFDTAVQASDRLRLATTDMTVQHVGNTLTPQWRERLRELEATTPTSRPASTTTGGSFDRIVCWRPIRGIMLRLCTAVGGMCQRILAYYYRHLYGPN